MPLLPPSPALLSMLSRLHQAGGVVELVAHDCGGASADSLEAHELVAREAASHYDNENGDVDRDSRLSGRRIELLELMGDRFDPQGHQLLFPSHLGLVPGAEADAALSEKQPYGATLEDGFARAFADPPYSLRLPCAEIDALFQGIWNELVGTWSNDDLVIMMWNTDAWASFDIGRDWWGSFLWTVARRDDGRFVSIAASTSD